MDVDVLYIVFFLPHSSRWNMKIPFAVHSCYKIPWDMDMIGISYLLWGSMTLLQYSTTYNHVIMLCNTMFVISESTTGRWKPRFSTIEGKSLLIHIKWDSFIYMTLYTFSLYRRSLSTGGDLNPYSDCAHLSNRNFQGRELRKIDYNHQPLKALARTEAVVPPQVFSSALLGPGHDGI